MQIIIGWLTTKPIVMQSDVGNYLTGNNIIATSRRFNVNKIVFKYKVQDNNKNEFDGRSI